MRVSGAPLLLILPAFYVVLYLLPLNVPYLWQPDETRYAEISRGMAASGDWIVPRLLELRYFEKPVAGYWVNALSQLALGHSNFSARFGAAFSTGVSALLVFCLARLMRREAGEAAIASLVYLSMIMVAGIGTYAVLDPMLAMWMTTAMLCSYPALNAATPGKRAGAYVFLGLACGMGFLTKGFIAPVVPACALFPAAVRQKRLKEFFTFGLLAVAAAVLISLPWSIAVALREPDYWRYFFWVEHIQRFAAEDAQHAEPFWYYLPVLAVAAVPWLGFLPGALLWGWKERRSEYPSHRRSGAFFLFSWTVMPFLFFSAARGKLPTYILPCMAPLALLMADYALSAIGRTRVPFKVNAAVNLFLAVAGLAAILAAVSGALPEGIFSHERDGRRMLAGIVLFALLLVPGALAWRRPRYWILAAACTPLLFTGYLWLLPEAVSRSKQPQPFIRQHLEELRQCGEILANEPGVAYALAWELKRGDIMLYDRDGELEYGIGHADDGRMHMVRAGEFPTWLERARAFGRIGLVIRSSKSMEHWLSALPRPDAASRTGRHLLFIYNQS